jgi:hypothetical protein
VRESRTKPKRRRGTLARQANGQCSPWTWWVRSMIDRYRFVKQLLNSPEMTLVHPFTTVRLMRERWFLASREFKPQINLFIHPNLKLSRNLFSNGVITLAEVKRENHERSDDLTLAVGAPPVRVMFGGEQVRYDTYLRPATRWLSYAADHRNPLEPNSRELTTNRSLEIDETSHVRRNTQVLESSRKLAQRLTQNTRRVEARIERLAALTLQRNNATGEGRATARKRLAEERSAPARMGADEELSSSMQAPPVNSGIDVYQLTDQVIRELDRRIVATRERIGRF